jgi:site-specific recombinase XerD
MKEMGHADIKTTMIYVSLGKRHIKGHVNKLDINQGTKQG